ncbi:MAG: hypothetical protein Q8O40_12805 [Chloroflexota bacterium]|nr:hypothetical protein [Chloroflexota bacterium]
MKQDQQERIKILLVLCFAFLAIGTLAYFLGVAIYGGREFTISLLASTVGVFWGLAVGTLVTLVSMVPMKVLGRRSVREDKTQRKR